MATADSSQHGAQEKRWAAMSSVVAAVGLTGFKIIVGRGMGSNPYS